MKKILLTSFFITMFGIVNSNAQTSAPLSKKEAKEIAQNINSVLDEVFVAIENLDVNELNNAINETLQLVERNADALVTIVKKVNTEKLQQNAEKLAEKIEQNVDVELIEKRIEKAVQKIEKAIQEKK